MKIDKHPSGLLQILLRLRCNACRVILFSLSLCAIYFISTSCDNKKVSDQAEMNQRDIEFDSLRQRIYDPLKKTPFWLNRSEAVIKYGYSLKGKRYDGVLIDKLKNITGQIREKYSNSEFDVKLNFQSFFISPQGNYLYIRIPFDKYKYKKSNNWLHITDITLVIVVDSFAEHILAIYLEGEA